MSATRTHRARVRESRYHPAVRITRVPADNVEKLTRMDRE